MGTEQTLLQGLESQTTWVRREVDALVKRATDNVDGMGIHKTQVDALDVLMKELDGRVDTALDALRNQVAPDARATATRAFYTELVGRGEVWQIFRSVFLARRDPLLQPLLDTADMVAAQGFKALQDQAIAWKTKIVERPPPLVVLRAATGAAAAGVQHTLKAFADSGFLVRKFRDEPLPIAIVLISPEQCSNVWRMVSLFHELGHLFDASLDLSTDLKTASVTADLGGFDEAMLRASVRELLADVIGVALGGDAFVSSLALDLFANLHASRVHDPSDVHPNAWIRLPLLFELATAFQIALPATTTALLAEANALELPAWATPQRDAVKAIATFLTTTKLPNLANHTLLELSRPWAQTKNALAKLEKYFADPSAIANMPLEKADGIAWDHLPIAAERVRWKIAKWSALHDTVLAYADAQLTRPQRLGLDGTHDPIPGWQALAKAFQLGGSS